MTSPRRSTRRLLTTSAFGALALAAVWAAPAHAQLVQGATPAQNNGTLATTINQAGNTTTVTLGDATRTVIDWDKFDINSGDTANFVFANRSDIVLNRVSGAGSTINGNLNGTIGSTGGAAGGNIWIYNANGVVIGANARISTGGLLVTTAAIDRATDSSAGGFLDGSSTQFGFTGASNDAGIAVRSGAQITSHGGSIALVSTSITTEAGSSVSAQDGGNVLYGAAAKYKISFRPTGDNDLDLLSFEVADGADGTANSGDALSLGGDTSGNRVFAAVVSKTNVFSRLLSTGTITASTAALDETGAIVLTTNHNIVNGEASAAAVVNNGGGDIDVDTGASVTAPAISMISSDSITTIMSSISAVGGTIDMLAEHGVLYGDGEYTADRLTARSQGDISLWTGLKNIGSIGGLRSDSGSIIFTNRMSATIDGDIVAAGTADITIEGIASGVGLIKAAKAKLNGDGVFHLDSATTLDFIGASNDLTVTSNGDLNLNLSGTGNDMATVTLQALSGSIRQTDSGYGLAGTVVAQALDDIDLDASANNFSSVTVGSTNGGDVTLRSARGFSVAGGSSGAFNLVSDTGDITANGVDMGGLTASAAGNIDFSGASNAIRALGDVNAGGDVLVSTNTGLAVDGTVNGGTLVTLHATGGDLTQGAGSLISGKTITVTASGSILQDENAVIHGTGVIAASTTVQAGGDLILAGANQLADYGNVFLGWGSGSDVTLRSANRIYFDGGATPIGTLTLIADNGNIQQGNIAFTADTLIASATQGIDLGTSAITTKISHLGNIDGGVTGDVTIWDGATTPITIDGTINSAGRVILTTRGAVSGSGTISAPQLFLDASEGGIFNIAGSTTLMGLATSNGDLTVNATGGLTVNAMVAGNNHAITLNAAGGDIFQSAGAVNSVTVLSLKASGAIAFGLGSYMPGIIAESTGGGNISLRNAGTTNLAVSTTGEVTLNGESYDVDGASHAGALTADLSGDLTLSLDSVDVLGALTIGHDLTLTATGNIALGDDLSAGNILSLVSTGGSISQTAGTLSADWIKLNAGSTISQSGGATLHSDKLSLTSGGNVTLGEVNNFNVFNDLHVSGDLTLRNLGSIRLDPLLTGGYTAGGALNLTSDTGYVIGNNAITASSVTASASGGQISLNGNIAALGSLQALGNISVASTHALALNGTISSSQNVDLSGTSITQAAGSVISGFDLNLTASNGAIDQDAAARVSVSDYLQASASADLLLRGANDFGYNDPYLMAGIGKDLTARSAGGFTFHAYNNFDDLTLISDSGDIRQLGGFTANTLTARAGGELLLTAPQGTNTVTTVKELTAGTDITFLEGDGFDLAGDISAPGTISFGTSGAITWSGGQLSAGTLQVTAGGGAEFNAIGDIKLGASNTSGGDFYLGTTGNIDLVGAIDTGGRNLSLYASDGAITTHGGTIATGGGASVTNATAKGGITLVGAGFANFWATSTNGGDINLSASSDLAFSVNTTGDVTIDSAASVGNSGDVIAHSLGINAGNGISVYGSSATVDVGSYRYLTTAAGQLDIQTPGDINLDGDVTVGGSDNSDWIHLQSTSGSILQNSGKIAGGYSINLEAAQSIIQDASARMISNGPSGLYLTGTDVILPGANQIDAISSYTVSHDFTLRNQGDIALWGNIVRSTGDWTLTSDTGSISGTVQGDKLTATATQGSINFGPSPGSEILELGDLTAKNTGGDDIYIYSNSLLELTGNITGGGVKIYATDGINQTAGGITADRLFTGTAADLLLGGANNFGALLDFGHANSATVTIRNHGDIALPSTPNSFGTLTLTSDTGGISQAGAITVATLVAQAATGIDLSNTSNNFTTLNGLSTTAGDIRIGDSGGFTIEADIRALAGTVALTGGGTGVIDTGTTTVGSVTTPHGKIDAVTVTASGFRANLYAKDDIKLGATSLTNGFTLIADGNIDLTGNLTGGASLIATTGSITQSSGIWTSSLSAAAVAGQDLTLNGNNVLSSFYGQSNGGGTITLNNPGGGAINLGLSTTGNATISVGGNLTSSGITASNLYVYAGDIDLTNNVDVSSFSQLTATYGDVRVTQNHGFTIYGDVTASTVSLRSINLQATSGDITQTAGTISAHDVTLRGAGDKIQSGTGRIVANVTTLFGANLDLLGSNHFGNSNATVVNAAGTVKLNSDVLYLQFMGPAGDVTLTADGNLTLNNFGLTATSLTAHAGGQLQMSNSDNFVGTIHGLSGTNISYTSGAAFTIDGDVAADAASGIVNLTASSGDLSQTAGTISGNTVNLTANAGSVLQSGTGRVVADALAVIAHAGDIALSGANDFNGAASGFYWDTGSDVSIRNSGSIAFTGGNVGALDLVSDNGAITQVGAITAASLNASGATGVTLNTSGNAIDTVGTLNGGTGNVTLKTANALTLTGDITGDTVTLTGASTITQNTGDIIANNFTANGTALAFNATNHVAEIDVLNASAGSVSFVNRTGILIGGHVSATQDVALTSQIGAIEGSGYISANALNLSSARNITLDNAANTFSSLTLYAMAGDVSLTNHNGFQIGAGGVDADIHSVTFDLGSGSLTSFDANSTITAGRLNLTSMNGSATVYGGATFALGDISLGTGTLDVTVAGSRDLTLAGNILARTVWLSSGGTITQSGGVMTAGTLYLSSGGDIALDSANNVANLGAVSTGAGGGQGDFLFRNAGDIVIGSSIDATGKAVTLRSNTGAVTGAGAITGTSLLVSAETGIALTGTNTADSIAGLSSTAGGIEYRSASGFTILGNVNSGTADTVLRSTGGAIQQAFGTVITANKLTASAATSIELRSFANHIGSFGALTAGSAISIYNGQTVNLTDDVTGATVALLATVGTVSQSGGVITASSLDISANTGVDLNSANNFGTLVALSSYTGDVRLRNTGNIVLPNVAVGGNLTLTSDNGSITQGGGTGVSVYGTTTLSANTGINLGNLNDFKTLGKVTNLNSGGITVLNLNDLFLTDDINAVGQQVSLTSTDGVMLQQGGTMTAGNLIAHANGTLAFDSTNVLDTLIGTELVSTTGAVSFHSVNAIVLGTVSTQNVLLLTADAGNITQTVAISAGTLSATALDGDILFDQTNTIGTIGNVTAKGSFTFKTGGNLRLDGNIVAPDLVTLNAGGNLTQIGTGVITTDLLQATSGAGASDGISLLNQNDVGQVEFNANGKDVRFRNVGNIAIGNINAVGRTIELISDNGKITQTDPVNGGLLGSLILSAATGIELLGRDNQIEHLDVTHASGSVSIGSGGNFVGGDMTIDRIDAADQNVYLTNGVGAINGGNITADYLYVFALGGDLTAAANHVGTLNLHVPTGNFAFTNVESLLVDQLVASTANISLRSEQGAITQAANALVAVDGLTAYGRDGVTLSGSINRIDGLSAGTGADVFVASDYALELAGDITARNVTLRSNSGFNNGAILQTGGVITADLLTASAYGDVSLTGNNQIAGLGGLLSINNGQMSLISTGPLDISGDVTTTNTVSFDIGTGALTQSGGTISVGEFSITAGEAILDRANAVSSYALHVTGDVDLNAVGAVRIRGQANTLTLNAQGNISQSGGLTIGALDAHTTSGSITLDLGNHVGSIAGLSAPGAILVRNADALAIAGDVSSDISVTFDIAGNNLAQNSGTITADQVSLTAGGAISQDSLAAIVTASLTASAGTGLSLGGANQIDTSTLSTLAGDLLFRNVGDLDAASFTTPGGLTLIADGGSITQSAALAIGGAASFTATGDITLDDDSNSFGSLGVLSAGGDLTLHAANLVLAGNVNAQTVWLQTAGDIDQTGGIVTADSLGGIADGRVNLANANAIGTIGELRALAGDVTLHTAGNMLLTDAVAAAGHNVTFTSDTGWIHQANDPDAVIYGATLTANAATGLELSGINQVSQLLGLSGGAAGISFTNATGFDIGGTIDAHGQAVFLSGGSGAITQSAGTIIANLLGVTASDSITLNAANQIAALAAMQSFNGDISITSTTALDLTGTVKALGLVSLDASRITNSSAHIEAARLYAKADAGVDLDGANVIGAGGVTLLASNGDVSFANAGNLMIAQAIANGTMTLSSAGGKIAYLDSSSYLEAARLNATASQAIGLGLNRARTIGHLESVNGSIGFSALGALTLDGDISAATTVLINAYDAIDQTSGSITAPSLSIQTYNGGSSITLGQLNHVDALGDVRTPGADFTFRNAGELGLAGVIDTLNLSLTSENGAIRQIGPGRIQAITLSAAADGDIVFGNDGNILGSLGVLSAGGDLTLHATNLVLGGNVNAQSVWLQTAGDIDQTGGIVTASSLGGIADGEVSLGNANVIGTIGELRALAGDLTLHIAGNMLLTDAVAAAGHDVTLTADGGWIHQASDPDAVIYGATLTATAGNGLDLSGLNQVSRLLGLSGGADGIAFANATGFEIRGNIDAHGQALSLSTGAGAIRQFSGSIVTDMLGVSASDEIRLIGANHIAALAGVQSSNGNINLANQAGTTAMDLTGAVISTRSVTIDALAVTSHGGYIEASDIGIRGENGIDLMGANRITGGVNLLADNGDVSFANDGDIALTDVDVSGTLKLVSANGGIGAYDNLTTVSAGRIDWTAKQDIDFAQAIDVATIGHLESTQGAVTFAALGGLTLDGNVSAATSVSLAAADAIDQADGVITAQALDVHTSNPGGSITLDQANRVDTLSASTAGAAIRFTNAQDLALSGSLTNSGDIALTVDGALNAHGFSISGANVTLATQGLDLSALTGTGSVSVDGGTGAVTLDSATAGDDLSLVTTGNLSVGDVQMNGLADAGADGFNILLSGHDVVLGSLTSPGSHFLAYGAGVTPGAAAIEASGNATIRLNQMNAPVSIDADGAVFAQTGSSDLQLGTVSGTNVSLYADQGTVFATSVDLTGDYIVRGYEIASGAQNVHGARDIYLTDTNGDMTLSGTIAAGRDLIIDASGSILGNGSLAAGASQTGSMVVTAANITLQSATSSTGSILLDTRGHGSIDVGSVSVADSYGLNGTSFSAGALAPLGAQTGSWSIAGDVLDLGGYTLVYNGDIFLNTAGAITNVSAHSLQGGITATGASVAMDDILAAGAVTVRAMNGAAAIGHASAGGNLSVSATGGDAILRQASLTGTTGDLTLSSDIGKAVLGEDDTLSGVGADRWFERAAGSSGTATIAGATGAFVNLDHSARIDSISADTASINIANGGFSLGSAYIPHGFVLTAAGDITLGAETQLQVNNLHTVTTGGATLVSLGGDITVNLVRVTGLFDAITASAAHDVTVFVRDGDLGIGDLAGRNLGIQSSGVLTLANPKSSGGDYMLTAADFAGNALSPGFFGGATALHDVRIGDTDGDLTLGGSLTASGNIAVTAQGDVNGALSLAALGDLSVDGRSIRLSSASGRDVRLTASGGSVDVTGALQVGRNYSLDGTEFLGNALAPIGTRTGNLIAVDHAGDFTFGALDLGFGGTATLSALGGAIRGGGVTAIGDLTVGALGDVETGILHSDNGAVSVTSGTNIAVDGIEARNSIYADATGSLHLGSAALSGTGVNSLNLSAGDQLVFGAADAASIGANNVFTNAGTLAAPILSTDLDLIINLDRAARFGALDSGTLQLTVRDGDLVTGNISTVGAIVINGPSGTTTLGDVDTSAGPGHINIAGGGDVSTGSLTGRFVVNVSSSTGSLTVAGITGDNATLAADRGISATGAINANSLDLSAGGAVDLTGGAGSQIGTLGAVTVTNGGFALRNLQGLVLNGAVDIDGTLDLDLAGALVQSGGTVTAQRLTGSIGGAVQLGGGNAIATLGDLTSIGLLLDNATALAIDGLVDGGTGAVTIRSHGGMTIAATGGVRSAAADDAITLASDGRFVNQAGAGALAAPNGRWLVYSQVAGNAGASDPTNDFGGLAGLSYYGAAYDFGTGSFAATPNAGNRFVYGYRPVLTVTPGSQHLVYDGTIPTSMAPAVTGFVNGDSVAAAWSGSAEISGAGRNAGTYTVSASLGSLVSDMNYDFAFGTGTLIIDPRVITAALVADSRTYNGTTDATGHLELSGVIAGDTVSVSSTGIAFDSKNAGTRTATASGIALNGADAGNYVVNASATDLADILARAITATLTADGRIYDGTTGATGSLSLSGLIAGDTVGVSSTGIAFDSKNAGTRTATASGITLNGADAGNYTVNLTATDLADILARAITATLTADDRIYDGTTGATGTLGLSGVLAGDQVSANGTLAFDNKNAGTGHTVTASGITLGGADAGNYTVSTTATDLADIFARAITASLAADGRTYDGTTAATGTLSLDGVIAGDSIGASGNLAFDSKNAGTRTVTASGIALTGADAANYTVNASATDLADILARTITATLAANGRTYDGTTAATGTLSLNGVLGGDQVSVGSTGMAFDSKNAGTGRTVTASGVSLSGADAGNYVIDATATGLADILAKAITATLTANDRTYGGTTNATGTLALSGVLGTDQVSAGGTLAFDNKNAGTGHTVTAGGITLSGADAGNYTVNATATDLADILARAITASLAADGRTYDGTTNATGTLSLDGVIAGDTVSASSTGLAFDSKNAGTGRTVTASGITLNGADAGNYIVNTTATDLADILARAITATLAANGRVYDGTNAATGTLALNGVLSGDQVAVSAGAIAFDSKNAGNRTATASGLTLGGADAANYTIADTATGTATIAQRAITATATADSRVYDGTTVATGNIALSGVIAGDTVTGTASYRFGDASAGTGRAVQVSGLGLSGADAGNYSVTLAGTPVTADILRRAITVTVNDATKISGTPDPAFGYHVTAGTLVAGEGFTGAPAREAGEQAGRYAIGAGDLALSANYLLTIIPGTLVVTLTDTGAQANDVLRSLQIGFGMQFSTSQDPSRNLEGDGDDEDDGEGDR